MTWLRIDDRFTANAKIAALSDSDFRVWMRLLCYCASTDRPVIDALPMGEVKGLSRSRVLRYQELDLLTEEGDDLVIQDWSYYNPPKDKTRAERARRYRKRVKKRASSRVTERVTNDPSSRASARVGAIAPPVPQESLKNKTLADIRPRDEVWDALTDLFGEVAAKTNGHARRNKATTDLKRQHATAEDVALAARVWPQLFPQATLTDIALATHYPQLIASTGRKPGQPASKPCAECGVGGGQHQATCSRGVTRGTPASTAA